MVSVTPDQFMNTTMNLSALIIYERCVCLCMKDEMTVQCILDGLLSSFARQIEYITADNDNDKDFWRFRIFNFKK